MEILLYDAKDEDDNETPAHHAVYATCCWIHQVYIFLQFAFLVSDVGITGLLAF